MSGEAMTKTSHERAVELLMQRDALAAELAAWKENCKDACNKWSAVEARLAEKDQFIVELQREAGARLAEVKAERNRLREQVKYVVAQLDPIVGTGNEPVEHLVRMAVKRITNG
jgi:hypothetical protein